MRTQTHETPSLIAALELEALGFWVVAIHPAGATIRTRDGEKIAFGKEPMGKAWGVDRRDKRWLRERLRQTPGAGLGICFGPGRGPNGKWLADLEGDGDLAAGSLETLLGGEPVTTAGWDSARGGHNLFTVDGDRLLSALTAAGAVEGRGLKAGVHKLAELPDLEFRIGGLKPDGVVKQVQSVVPPTYGTDGKPRAWTNPPSFGVTDLPERAYVFLEGLAIKKPHGVDGETAAFNRAVSANGNGHAHASPWEMIAHTVEDRAIRYLAKIEPAVQGSGGSILTFRAACVMVRFGLDFNAAFRLLKDYYNPRCQPPWSDAELHHKLEDAYKAEPNAGAMAQSSSARSRRAASQRGSAQPATGSQRPQIVVTTEEHVVIEEAIAALTAEANLFQRGGSLVSILAECKPRSTNAKIKRPAGSLRIASLPAAQIRRLLTLHAEWVKPHKLANNGFELIPTRPPAFTVEGVATMGIWTGIRPLEGIVETPTLRPDGSLLDQPGYDPDTGLWFAPNGDFPKVPNNPTLADAQAAMGRLLSVVDDFPFAKPEYAATWLAALLTALARVAIDGCVPLFLFNANCPATGKSKLSDIIAILATGREMPRGSYPDDQDEMQKMLLSVAMGGDRMLLFDNVATGFSIGGSTLDRAVTARTMKGRILGRSEMTAELPMNVVFFVTGNNLGIKGDALRRVVPCVLETTEERPEERSQFAVSKCGCGCGGNLLAHVKINRGELVCSALTILRGYIVAGMPEQALLPMDFAEWSGLVRNAVKWVSSHDPCEGRKAMIADDEETNAHRALVNGLAELCGDLGKQHISAADMLAQIEKAAPQYPGLGAVLCSWSRDGSLPSPITVGKRFAKYKGRPIDGKALRSTVLNGIMQWEAKAV